MRGEYQGLQVAWAGTSHVGQVRTLNEDAYHADLPVFVVADGMGGHQAGEVASAIAVAAFESLGAGNLPTVDEVAAAVGDAHRSMSAVTRDGRAIDLGTTVVGLVLVEHAGLMSWLLVNIGDSRAYSLYQGSLTQLTVDHSLVQDLVDSGQITPSEARHHPERNVITRALGAVDVPAPDYWVRAVSPGERFLLCSDGLTGELTDQTIAKVLSGHDDPESAADALCKEAVAAGGRDNVTAIVVDVLVTPTDPHADSDTSPGSLNTAQAPSNTQAGQWESDAAVISRIPAGLQTVDDEAAAPPRPPVNGHELIDSVPAEVGLPPEEPEPVTPSNAARPIPPLPVAGPPDTGTADGAAK